MSIVIHPGVFPLVGKWTPCIPESSGVGGGTRYPLGFASLDDVMRFYWIVRQWNISIDIEFEGAAFDTINLVGNADGGPSVGSTPIDEESILVCGNAPVIATFEREDAGPDPGTSYVHSYSFALFNPTQPTSGSLPPLVTHEGLYYPMMSIFGSTVFLPDDILILDITSLAVTVENTDLDFTFLGTQFPAYSSAPVSGTVAITANEYWSYDGTWDTSNGDLLIPANILASTFIQPAT